MPNLTVPSGGLNVGRAAQVREVESGTADVARQLGKRMEQVGNALEEERVTRSAAQARITITERLSALRMQQEQLNDPDAIEAGWVAGRDTTRAEVLDGLDPRLADRVALIFDEQAAQHNVAIGGRAITARQSHARVMLNDTYNAMLRGAAQADPATRRTFQDQIADAAEEAMNTGALSPEQAQELVANFASESDGNAALYLLDNDPGELVRRLEANEYPLMDPGARPGLLSRARAAAAANDERAAKAAEVAARERDEEIGDTLEEMRAVAMAGRRFNNEATLLANPSFAAHPEYAATADAVLLRDDMPSFNQLPVWEMDEAIEAERANPVAGEYALGREAAMIAARDRAAAAWEADPVQQAFEAGLATQTAMPDLSTASDAEIARFLRSRATLSRTLTSGRYVDETAIFTAEELEAVNAAISADADPQNRSRLAGLLASAPGNQAYGLFEQLGGDPVFTHMGQITAATGDAHAARLAFQGQTALADNSVEVPKPDVARSLILSITADTFDGHEEMLPRVRAAADAIYAGLAAGRAASDLEDESDRAALYGRAVQMAMGARGEGANQTGGMQDVNGYTTRLPPNVRARDVEDAMSRAAAAVNGFVIEYNGALGLPSTRALDVDPNRAWEEASLTGGLPTIAGEPLTAHQMGSIGFAAVGNGQYVSFVERRGQRFLLEDSVNGGPWQMDMDVFIREAGR